MNILGYVFNILYYIMSDKDKTTKENILKEIEKNNSAEELNKNTQSIYVYDFVYVICKVFLFIILGAIYALFFKNAETIKDVIKDAKDNMIVAKDKITEKIKPMLKKDGNAIKAVEIPKVEKNTNMNTNTNTNKNSNAKIETNKNKNTNTNKQPKL